MLMLENTKNCLGIRIIGDYNDLKELYDAVSVVCDIHFDMLEKYTKTRLDIDDIEKNALLENNRGLKNYMMMLCGDLKEAYNGQRGIVYIGDDENVYYSCVILYPWAAFFMLSFSAMADEHIRQEDLRILNQPCTIMDYDGYKSILNMFSMKVWNCVNTFLGKQKTFKIYSIIHEKVENIIGDAIYIDAYCNYYCDPEKATKKEHKAMLLALLYEYIIYDDKEKSKEYKQAIREVEDYIQEKFLSNEKFKQDVLKKYHQLGYMSQEDFNKFKESYGHVDWKHLQL